MSKHTPTPWKMVTEDYVMSDPESSIDSVFHSFAVENTEGHPIVSENCSLSPYDLERIVACVNACEGINPEAVPDMYKALTTVFDQLTRRKLTGPITEQVADAIAKAERRTS